MGRPLDIELETGEPGMDAAADRLRAEVARRREQRDGNASEVVRQIDEAARRKAEERAALEAAEKARREAEESARRAAEEEARKAAEEELRRRAEENERRQAAELARREAEAARVRAEEERRRQSAERKARREAQERARIEEEARDKAAIQERLRQRRERRRRVLWPSFAGAGLAALAAAAFVEFYSFESRRIEFEQAASELLGQPVTIGRARLGFAPQPQWRLDDVRIGGGAEAVRIARLGVVPPLKDLFGTVSEAVSLRLDHVQVSPSAALGALYAGGGAGPLKLGELRATDVRFAGMPPDLPPIDLRAAFRDGALTSVSAAGEQAEVGSIKFELKRADQWQLVLQASQLRWLLGPEYALTDIAVKGSLTPEGLRVGEFAAGLYGGDISGSGMLTWQGNWRLTARLDAKYIDSTKLARGWFREGRISAQAVLAASSGSARTLLSSAGAGGSFAIDRGTLDGTDLDKVLQDRGIGEETRFETLAGDFSLEAERLDFPRLELAAPGIKASGSLGFDAARNAGGRLALEARTPGSRRTGALKIGGTLAAPVYRR